MSSALTPALAASAALALLPFPVLCRGKTKATSWDLPRGCTGGCAEGPSLLGAAREAGCGREPWAAL